MSGTFNEICVPPTLITFAVTTDKTENIISSELKGEGNYLYLVKHTPKENMVPDYEQLKNNFNKVRAHILNKDIVSAATVKFGGIAEALCKMSFGNKIGVDVTSDEDMFSISIGWKQVRQSKMLISFC